MKILEHTRSFLLNRWMMVVSALFIMLTAGSTYDFGLYSQKIKTSLGYTQKTISTIGFFKDFGGNAGLIAGVLYDWKGPRVTLRTGAVLNLAGFLLVWLQVTNRISEHKELMNFAMFIAALSQCCVVTPVLGTIVKSFPRNRGFVTSWTTACLALSGAIFTLFYQAFCEDKPSLFILLLGILPSALWLLLHFPIRVLTPHECEDSEIQRYWYFFMGHWLLLALCVGVTIIVEYEFGLRKSVAQSFVAVILLITVSSLGIVVHSEMQKNQRRDAEQGQSDSESETSGSETLPDKDTLLIDTCCSNKMLYMLLIFLATACIGGGALMASDDIGQLGDSLGYLQSSTDFVIAVSNISNCFGRIIFGWLLQEILAEKCGLPRPFIGILLGLGSALGHLLIGMNWVWMGYILVGACLGGQWATISSITYELFPLKYYGTLYNLGGLANALGSYILSVPVAAKYYDEEAHKHHSSMFAPPSSSQSTCYGINCFDTSFFINAAVCVLGAIFYLLLTILTWKDYHPILPNEGELASSIQLKEIATLPKHSANSKDLLPSSIHFQLTNI